MAENSPLQFVDRAPSSGVEKAEAKLRAAQNSGDEKALLDAARDLESVFLGMLFNEMTKGVGSEEALFPQTFGKEIYEEWFRAEVAKEWSARGGLGIAEQMVQSISGTAAATYESARAAFESDPSLPVDGRITSSFGARADPFTGEKSFHEGIDIAAPVGTPVRTPFVGRVISVNESERAGLSVTIEHPGGLRTVYAHNSEIMVEKGDSVQAGQVISLSGNTGRSTGPHLHFSVFQDKKAIDPAKLLNFSGSRPIF